MKRERPRFRRGLFLLGAILLKRKRTEIFKRLRLPVTEMFDLDLSGSAQTLRRVREHG